VLRLERRPLAAQLRDQIWDYIDQEQLDVGDRLPSEQELVDTFGVSRATVREALKILEEERVILCQHGVGRFVAPDPGGVLSERVTHLKSVTDMAQGLGITLNTKVLSVKEELPDEKIRARLNLAVDQRVVFLERLRMSDVDPIIYSIDVFSRGLVKSELDTRRFEGSLLEVMEGEWGAYLAYSKATISAEMLDRDMSHFLNVPDCVPWILMEQVNYNEQDQPVLYSKDYHRGDRFKFRVLRRRR
jgi:GntR family transcriptional regulator